MICRNVSVYLNGVLLVQDGRRARRIGQLEKAIIAISSTVVQGNTNADGTATGKAEPGTGKHPGTKIAEGPQTAGSRAAHEEGRRLRSAAPLPSPGPTASSQLLGVRRIDLLWWVKGVVDVLEQRVNDWPITRRAWPGWEQARGRNTMASGSFIQSSHAIIARRGIQQILDSSPVVGDTGSSQPPPNHMAQQGGRLCGWKRRASAILASRISLARASRSVPAKLTTGMLQQQVACTWMRPDPPFMATEQSA
ncbi:uncharacterized protein CC84DRAFT_1171566 [Paraphaeosphaeria sporulosa]|uniref:Uncharacterized protein n=1 Tax=Paraphaeosphaeria sporulosa TaxID=1460663 RepID=A0A177D1B4_9PLEO|nr:uncharacterized protein CC84DRAFT_1171566 [Paraphaeosphaeria sporulosa]OAG12920.1 hypothetical protein CC84DRAFT_1171566 [Paraphaeosphaeria sporulosa]